MDQRTRNAAWPDIFGMNHGELPVSVKAELKYVVRSYERQSRTMFFSEHNEDKFCHVHLTADDLELRIALMDYSNRTKLEGQDKMAIKRDIIYAQCEKAGVRSPMVIPASPDIQSLMGTVFFTKRTTSWAIKEAMTTINHLSVMTRRTGFQTCLTQIAVLCCMAW